MNCEKKLKCRGRNKDDNWMEETNGRRKRHAWTKTGEREVTTNEFGVPYPKNRIMKSVEAKTRHGMRWRMKPAVDCRDFLRRVRVFVDVLISLLGPNRG